MGCSVGVCSWKPGHTEKPGQGLQGWANWFGENQTGEPFLFAGKRPASCFFFLRSALREFLSESWNVDTHKALRICEDREVRVEASEASQIIAADSQVAAGDVEDPCRRKQEDFFNEKGSTSRFQQKGSNFVRPSLEVWNVGMHKSDESV